MRALVFLNHLAVDDVDDLVAGGFGDVEHEMAGSLLFQVEHGHDKLAIGGGGMTVQSSLSASMAGPFSSRPVSFFRCSPRGM